MQSSVYIQTQSSSYNIHELRPFDYGEARLKMVHLQTPVPLSNIVWRYGSNISRTLERHWKRHERITA